MNVSRFTAQRTASELGVAIHSAIQRVITSGCYIGGAEVECFECECERYLGCQAAVACASGTDAIELALRSLGLPSGSLVATTAFTFAATASAIVAAGLRPMFVDIDQTTMQICPDALRRTITSEVSAVLPVSLYGRPLDKRIFAVAAERELPVVEDACQSFGAGVDQDSSGRRATLTAFSFFPTKPLGCMGDGGMVVTSDLELAARVRAIGRHGVTDRKHFPSFPGRNSRLDAMQAAILRAKLPFVQRWRRRRESQAATYERALASLVTPPAPHPGHAWALYAIRCPRRDDLLTSLRGAGIDAAVFYPSGLHQTAAFRSSVHLPQTEEAANKVLCLPISATITDEENHAVIEAVARWAETSRTTRDYQDTHSEA